MKPSTRLFDLISRLDHLRNQGQTVTPEAMCADCPELLDDLKQYLRLDTEMASRRKIAPPGEVETVTAAETTSPVSDARVPDVPGFEILGELGRGGMGVVYKARHLKLNRIVALKMILTGGYAGNEELARFRAEGEAIARLQHANIVQIHEIGEFHDSPFFSLEFCMGGNVSRKSKGTPWQPRDAANLVETVAHGMEAAHQKGIVHRDLKPANILLAEDGTPKITDFGLAKFADDTLPHELTKTGQVMGTPSYMAPEQAAGKTNELGPAVDIYALGAILYELLTGRPPFKAATTMDTLWQVMNSEPVPPSQLQPTTPCDLETICLKCLGKTPEKRYATARDLADDLRRYLAGEPILARPV